MCNIQSVDETAATNVLRVSLTAWLNGKCSIMIQVFWDETICHWWVVLKDCSAYFVRGHEAQYFGLHGLLDPEHDGCTFRWTLNMMAVRSAGPWTWWLYVPLDPEHDGCMFHWTLNMMAVCSAGPWTWWLYVPLDPNMMVVMFCWTLTWWSLCSAGP